MQRAIFTEEQQVFRDMVRDFFTREIAPQQSAWEHAGAPPADFFKRVAELGIMGIQIPEVYGGAGESTYKFNAIVTEEAVRAGLQIGSLRTHLDMALSYLLAYADAEQKQRWLPRFVAGDLIAAIAMTEPGTGSDLAGVRTTGTRADGGYVINGSKTFITGAVNATHILTVVRTSPLEADGDRRSGLSLIAVETDRPGYSRGRLLEKIGMKAQDTSEIFFDDVWVPEENLLGEEGRAFAYLSHNLAQERLSIAVNAQAAARFALDTTLAYVRGRTVFGQPLAALQNTKFELADCATDVEAGQAFVDRALDDHDAGVLDPADAAKLKLFCTQMQGRVVDRCLQLHGGYGYMLEYPIARLYTDARVTRIYGGSSEVLKSVISKSLLRAAEAGEQ
ncbi:acyl-CoA dehydrogenase family protein [Streptomyces melanosporofaciens]|uniref:Acyl-[acyl-carrier-protein] dehydrogenase MbtN n=1 Tax=Streptomyces melanosporofaciens TaxID=67327 RepID=A0A1H4KK57_STRMJ|nr:acyl-CoA dehydrogenase family protein [Streptomyces melanosporofaciens]SEB58867.1 long-chain-acyl-CoA dehydrogenase [Streptomyces melanosporofaciens]